MPSGGTYPSTIKVRGRTYRFVARAYADNVYQGKEAKRQLNEEARKERKRGNLTKMVVRKGKTHTVYFLYSCPKAKKK